MAQFKKLFANTATYDIQREVELQKKAASLGLSPEVYDTDYKTYITMEHIEERCLADKYGDLIKHIPIWIRREIVEILWTLYSTYSIQYIDVTPYNFIEKNGRVWIIDFGHATQHQEELNPYLENIFNTWKLSRWNKDFK